MKKRLYAIDWSHRKGLAIYDGRRGAIVDRKFLLKKLAEESTLDFESSSKINPAGTGAGGKSIRHVTSNKELNPPAPTILLEQGCPLSLIYDILRIGCRVSTISNRATQDYRVEHGIEKGDETDAKIIYELANNGAKLTPVSLDDNLIQLVELYQRYKRYQKARVAMVNMRKAYIRQFGDGVKSREVVKSIKPLNNPSPDSKGEGESKKGFFQSSLIINPSPSDGTLPYDISIDTLKAAESSCLKRIAKLAPPVPQSLKIKGLGPRIWAGIFITANPANFPTLSSYLRYCGLVNLNQLQAPAGKPNKWIQSNGDLHPAGAIRYNRHARMLYHMLADEVMKQRDAVFRPIYDQCKADIPKNHPEYTKMHIHNAALNRTATFLAKEIWRQKHA